MNRFNICKRNYKIKTNV